jgi:hypothetical protein
MQVPENLRRKIRHIREELMALAGNAQVIMDSTGAYAIFGDEMMNLMEDASDDMLSPYIMDVTTAPEEEYDLTKDTPDFDVPGLLSVAVNSANPNGQRVNAYRRLGEYIHVAQMKRTTTSIEQELREHSRQSGPRLRTIALRAKGLAQGTEMLRPKDLRKVTPDWLYRLSKQEYERLVQTCEEANLQRIRNNEVRSQELPFEGGNVCDDDEGLEWWYEESSAEIVWRGNDETQMMEMIELHNDGNDGVYNDGNDGVVR